MDLVEAVRGQADACARLGSPMYADLLGRVAEDLAAGGPTATVLADHTDAPGPSGVALRLAGSVHRLVLQRRAGPLAAFYPSVGGTWRGEAGWAAFRELVAEQPDAVREWLDRPPQTNEVGRASALVAGLLELGRRHPLPVRLVEVGASGGLNLLADRFRYVADDGRGAGPPDSPVVLAHAWTGPVALDAPWPRIAERLGTDVMPVDVATTEGRLLLTAYVWPDQRHRLERLRGAFRVAAEHPVRVTRAGVGETLDALDLADGRATVVWHSVMWQYVPREEQERATARLHALGDRATDGAPLAHVFLEPTRRSPDSGHEFLVVLETWPGGERRVVGTSQGHGVPTVVEGPAKSLDS